ncbi:hypothetical protein FAY30_08575 [Bacillus sp. S3]|nr:hypothetical protein FAY30_08575 [Bacillus sp. S3]
MLLFLLTGIVSGCQKDVPKPETKPKLILIEESSRNPAEIATVFNQSTKEFPSLFVQHKTIGNQVLVECIVNGISFREADRAKKKVGKMIIWVDGKQTSEVTSAAFIIKGLTPGSHQLKLEVVTLNNEPYGLAKEFMVNIPK